jgi:CRP-like cAMP-binding protein
MGAFTPSGAKYFAAVRNYHHVASARSKLLRDFGRHSNCRARQREHPACMSRLSEGVPEGEDGVTGRVRGHDRPKLPAHVREFRARSDGQPQNRLLALLPPTVFRRLQPHLQSLTLHRKEVLFRAHEPLRVAYFPSTAVVSLVSTLESGQSLEVGLVGRDGLAGTAVFPGITMMSCDGIVQIPGAAHRISAEVLRRELLIDEALYSTLGRFAQVLLVRSMQMSVCNMFHSVEQRCVRWLLTVSDLINNGDIPLTHDLMATMLGVHRPTVTIVLRSLHKAGLVNEVRGLIEIRDRHLLEAACCECYGVMREEQQRLLGY